MAEGERERERIDRKELVIEWIIGWSGTIRVLVIVRQK